MFKILAILGIKQSDTLAEQIVEEQTGDNSVADGQKSTESPVVTSEPIPEISAPKEVSTVAEATAEDTTKLETSMTEETVPEAVKVESVPAQPEIRQIYFIVKLKEPQKCLNLHIGSINSPYPA